MPTLVLGAAREDPARGGLVHGVGGAKVPLVVGEEMGLEHAIDAHQPLDGPLRRLRRLERVHEGDEPLVGGLRLLGMGAQLGQAAPQGVGVLGIVPDVAPHEELGGDLRGEGEPAAHDPHHPLGGVAVMPDQTSGVLDGMRAVQRIHRGISRPGSAGWS
jgi:hypothetical protein